MLQELFSVHFEEYQWNPDARKTNNATTLPINAYSHTTLPKDWIIVRVTRANANVFSRVAVALKDDEVGQGLLLDDIRKDIRVTVRQNLVAKDDLIHLKQLFKERRELFFPGYDDWLPTRSLKAIGSDWKEERGGGKELRRWFAGILARR
ncbi:hypothetical protein MPER_12895 [Moniliophthora perniciosa FA553]|nr:hypothetical protein MPER_12895 [Moniliophthora perniciosa FA553]